MKASLVVGKKIITLKQNEQVPSGAKFLYASEVQENHRVIAEKWIPSIEEFLSFGTRYKVARKIKCDVVTYFYYEVDCG